MPITRTAYTEAEKHAVRRRKRAFPLLTQKELGAWFEVEFGKAMVQSTVSEILSRKYDHLDQRSPINSSRKKARPVPFPLLESRLAEWYEAEQNIISITGDMVRKQASIIWAQLPEYHGIPPPAMSNGWLAGFKRRHGIKGRIMMGGEVEPDGEADADAEGEAVVDDSIMQTEPDVALQPHPSHHQQHHSQPYFPPYDPTSISRPTADMDPASHHHSIYDPHNTNPIPAHIHDPSTLPLSPPTNSTTTAPQQQQPQPQPTTSRHPQQRPLLITTPGINLHQPFPYKPRKKRARTSTLNPDTLLDNLVARPKWGLPTYFAQDFEPTRPDRSSVMAHVTNQGHYKRPALAARQGQGDRGGGAGR